MPGRVYVGGKKFSFFLALSNKLFVRQLGKKQKTEEREKKNRGFFFDPDHFARDHFEGAIEGREKFFFPFLWLWE